MRVALAGLGPRGRYWAEVLRRAGDSEIVAMCDPSEAALRQALALNGPCPTFPDLESALAAIRDVDAVVLATPPRGRRSQLEAAIERGLPVLVEKPLALDLSEAREFVELAEHAQVSLMVGLNFRYLDVTRKLKRLVDTGVVGAPAFAHFTYERFRDGTEARLNKYPLTMDHPMLWEQSIHHFDLMRFVYGRDVETVYARTWNPPWSMYRGDTNVAAIFTFGGGLSVTYQGTWQGNWIHPTFQWRTECTEGVVFQDDQFGALSFASRDAVHRTSVPLKPHEAWITDAADLYASFARAVAKEGPLECTGRDHLESLAMVEACVRSSADNRVVTVGEVRSWTEGASMGP